MAILLDGIKVNLGGKEYTVPPINLKALRQLGPKFASMAKAVDTGNISGLFEGAQLDTMLEVILSAMSRNYPDLTKDDLEEVVDLGNLVDLFGAVCAQSGLKKQEGAPGGARGPKHR